MVLKQEYVQGVDMSTKENFLNNNRVGREPQGEVAWTRSVMTPSGKETKWKRKKPKTVEQTYAKRSTKLIEYAKNTTVLLSGGIILFVSYETKTQTKQKVLEECK